MDPAREQLTIVAGGYELGGWLSSQVTRGVERLPSSFMVELTERFPGQVSEVPVLPGTTCQVYLSDDLILTGYIDLYRPAYDAERHTVTIAGRSKCEDLVDSAIDGNLPGIGWVFTAQTVGEAATRIARPFGIAVSLPDGDFAIPPPQTFPIMPGMTAYALLEELCRTAQCLLWDDANGNLVISGVGTTRAGSALVEGQNVENGEATLRTDIRYSDYQVIAQVWDVNSGHYSVTGKAYDQGMQSLGRYRLQIIPWEWPDTDGSYSMKRALWQAARNWGRGQMVRITVTGWRDANDQLWTPNTIVSIACPTLKIQDDYIISEVTWMRGERGTQTLLTCMLPEGLTPEPFLPQPPIPGLQEPAPSASSGNATAGL